MACWVSTLIVAAIVPTTTMTPARVIFMHGLGDTPHGWADILRSSFREQLPHVTWTLPEAPRAPVTCNGGHVMTSWMDLHDIPVTPTAYDDEPSLEASVGKVHAAIDEAVESGVPAERIVVGGFSQGGAMAWLSTLRYPKKLAGCIMLSGWPPLASKLDVAGSANGKTRFFLGHGTSDTTVLPQCTEKANSALENAGTPVSVKLYPGMAHGSCPEELRDVGDFLEQVLPQMPAE